ncbi:MAG: hypothetical protein ACD_22C00043G0001, partial [uncultured bacterium]
MFIDFVYFFFAYGLIFVFGLFVGSFLNVVADRSVKGVSFVKGRSRCENCKKTLQPHDLIPLLSFILSRGKCRYCGEKLSFWYPLSEYITGCVFVGVSVYTGFVGYDLSHWLGFLYLLIVACFYIVIFLTDAKYRLIPHKIVVPAIVFVFVSNLGYTLYYLYSSYTQLTGDTFGKYLVKAGYYGSLATHSINGFLVTLAGALGIGLFFWFLVFITRGRGMGGGDITLGFLIGLVNGFPKSVLA